MKTVTLEDLRPGQWIWAPRPGNTKRYKVLDVITGTPYKGLSMCGVTVRAEGGINRRWINAAQLTRDVWVLHENQED